MIQKKLDQHPENQTITQQNPKPKSSPSPKSPRQKVPGDVRINDESLPLNCTSPTWQPKSGEAGLCAKVEDYPYSTLKGMLGKSRIDVPVLDDVNWEKWSSRVDTLKWLNTAPEKQNLELVRKALRKETFKLGKIHSRPSTLENDAL